MLITKRNIKEDLYISNLVKTIIQKNREVAKLAVLGNIDTALKLLKQYEYKIAKECKIVTIPFSYHSYILAKKIKNYKYLLTSGIRIALFSAMCQDDIEQAIKILQTAVDFTRKNYQKDKNWNKVKRSYITALMYLSYFYYINNKKQKAIESLQKAFLEVFFLEWNITMKKIRKLLDSLEKDEHDKVINNFSKLISINKSWKFTSRKATANYLKTIQMIYHLIENFLDYIIRTYNKKALEKITEISFNEVMSMKRSTKDKEKYLKEIKELENKMLPPNFFENDYLQLAFKIIPAKEASGDIIDYYYNKKENKLIVIVADVTGHGIKAASIAMTLKSYFRSFVEQGWTGRNLLIKISQGTEEINKEGENICFNLIEIDEKKARIIGGGLPALLYYNSKEKKIHEYVLKGLPLGFPLYFYQKLEEPFSEITINYNPNDYIIIVSDGLLEQKISNRDIFGMRRVKSFLPPSLYRKDPPNLLIKKFIEEWQDYITDKVPEDDATILAIKFREK